MGGSVPLQLEPKHHVLTPEFYYFGIPLAVVTIGFFDADGAFFQLVDMEPLSEQKHYSSKPARYALELPQGDYARLGI